MWLVKGNDLQMAEGDYGVKLPVTINGTELGEDDSLKFTFKTHKNGDVIFEKEYNDIVDNTIYFEFTQSESAKFPVGVYIYSLDWYQNDIFMCNIILCSTLKVVDKA